MKPTRPTTPQSVCLFGLSGNPPTGTAGHQGLVQFLVNLKSFDEVWILPVYNHIYSSKRSLAPFENRFEMCRLAFESIDPIVSVKDTERQVHMAKNVTDPANKIGTADILDNLIEQWPSTAFSLCLGEDTYNDLIRGKWRRADDIRVMVGGRFEVFTRSSDPMAQTTSVEYSSSCVRFHTLQNSVTGVSSTQVRKRLCFETPGFTLEEDWVSPEVMEYISSHGLYIDRPDLSSNIEGEQSTTSTAQSLSTVPAKSISTSIVHTDCLCDPFIDLCSSICRAPTQSCT